MVRGIPLRLYLLTLIISVTAGCAATLETEIVVRDDDSAGIRYELSFQLPDDLPDEAAAELSRQVEAAQTQAQANVRAETQRLGIDPEAITFTSFNEDGRLGMRVGIDPVPRERLGAVLASGGADALFSRFAVDRDGDRLTLDAELTGESTLSAPASSGEQFAAGNTVLNEQPLTVVVAVRLPGQVTSHNADRVGDDGALVWDGQSQARTLTAQADIGGSPMLALLATAAVLVVAGGLLMLWYRTRRPARAGASAGWSVTADDPSARGAAFALAPGRAARSATEEDLPGPEDAMEDLAAPEDVMVPEEDLATDDEDLAEPAPPRPLDGAWWLNNDEDDLGPAWDDDQRRVHDDDLNTAPAGDELDLVPAGDDQGRDDDDLGPAWDDDVGYPAWDDDRPFDDPAREADESDDASVQDPSSQPRR
jgi:hypothetical protein